MSDAINNRKVSETHKDDEFEFNQDIDDSTVVDYEDDFDDSTIGLEVTLDKVHEFVVNMLEKKVHPRIIQSALIANWLQIVVMNCDESEEFFLEHINKLEELVPVVFDKLKAAVIALPAIGNDDVDAEARAEFLEVQKIIKELAKTDVSPKDLQNQEKIVEDMTEALFSFFEIENPHPLDIEGAFVMYWIHFLSIEELFTASEIEKLIYNGADIFEMLAIFVREKMGLEDAF